MDCVIHIGTEKTGTTSIQRTLDANAKWLANQGVFWPPMLRNGDDTRALCYALNDATADLRKTRRNLTTPAKLARFRKQFEGRFGRELAKAPKTQTVLVVNEHLSRLRERAELERLKQFLDGFCSRIRVVVYLRRQDRLMRSMYSQVVKIGSTRELVFPVIEKHADADFTTFNYRRIAELWAAVFGHEALEIRVFEKPQLAGGDVVQDFFGVAGVPLPDGFTPPKTNESLSADAILALRVLNRHLPRSARGNMGPLSSQLFAGSGIPVPRADAATFLSHFQDDNDHVARAFLGREQLFDPIGPEEYPEQVPPEALQIDLDTLARHFARLWEAKIDKR